MKSGTYTLSANITDPYTKASQYFSQSLTYQETVATPLVQTDKAIYGSGDNVQFRLFAVDSETLPINQETATFSIYDSSNPSVTIQSFENVTFVNGKFEGSLQLSDYPIFGSWRIDGLLGTTVSTLRL